jgi:hypothetical protein
VKPTAEDPFPTCGGRVVRVEAIFYCRIGFAMPIRAEEYIWCALYCGVYGVYIERSIFGVHCIVVCMVCILNFNQSSKIQGFMFFYSFSFPPLPFYYMKEHEPFNLR